MPTAEQIDARERAGTARRKLASLEALLHELSTQLAELRAQGSDSRDVAAALATATKDLAGVVADLDEAREAVLAGPDELGADLLDATLPVALLPVRLETRYRGETLLVRIYPDDIHRDGHEPALTRAEADARVVFLKAVDVARDRQEYVAAWQELISRTGAARALYIAEIPDGAQPGLRPAPWSRAMVARLLPDRFVAYAWTDAAGLPLRALAAAPVRSPLWLGPDPSASDPADDSPLGEGARWLHDFKEACAAGMAIEVPLGRSDAVVEGLVVLGARASVESQDQAAELGALLRAHDVTGGCALLPPGSPTNALGAVRPASTTRPDSLKTYDRALSFGIRGGKTQRRRPLYVRSPAAGGQIDRAAPSFALAEALGVDALALGYVAGGDDDLLAAEEAVRNLMRAVFIDGAARALAPGVDRASIQNAFDHMASEVSALGPFATLLVGAQPYGVLPVMVPEHVSADPFTRGLRGLLDRLREAVFAPAIDHVPRVGSAAPGDPEVLLVSLLRSGGIVRQLRVRPSLGAEFSDDVISAGRPTRRGFGIPAPQVELLEALGLPRASESAIARMMFLPDAAWVQRPLVVPVDASVEETPAAFLTSLRTIRLADLLAEQYPGPRPQATLFDLARRAVLAAADADARQALVDGGTAPELFDDPQSGVGTANDRLFAPTPADPNTALGDRLRLPGVPEARELPRIDAALAQLIRLPVAAIEVLLGGALGLLSHRLDAWYTSLATQRLRQLRRNPAPGNPSPDGFGAGIGAGAFGWVERIPRKAGHDAPGYVHARSAQHAATAGVLLSVDAAHRAGGHGDAFSVDLSSARVRSALELLDGIRAGQPLNALLGYRLERTLVESGGTAPALIAPLREAAPLAGEPIARSTAPSSQVAASQVVDGLALLRLATANGTRPPSLRLLPAVAQTADPQQQAALASALASAVDAVDAIGDLILSEGVFHLVGGQTTRAGAATDVLAGTLVPPPEADVVSTPARGTAVTHRVLVALDPASGPSAWPDSPRALAEPLLERWAASMLPPLSAVRLRGRFVDAGGQVVETVDTSLADALAAAAAANRPELEIGALDVVLDSFLPRVGPLLELSRLPADTISFLEIDPTRGTTFAADEVGAEELALVAAGLRALIGPSRALRPDDVPFPAAALTGALTARLVNARSAVTAVRDQLLAATDNLDRVTALLAADRLGVPTMIDLSQLPRQVAVVRADLDARLDAPAADRTEEDRICDLFGPTMRIVPWLEVDDDAADAFGEDLGVGKSEVRAFLSRAARVRPRVALLQSVLGNCDAIRGTPAYELRTAQRPHEPGEPWVALDGRVAGGRTSLVAVGGSAGPGAGRRLAGLLIDDWVEVVPSAVVDTSVAFRLPAPATSAPNAILLCVPEEGREIWTEASLLAHVMEARQLARLRSVEPDELGAASQILPAMLVDDDTLGPSFSATLSEPPENPL